MNPVFQSGIVQYCSSCTGNSTLLAATAVDGSSKGSAAAAAAAPLPPLPPSITSACCQDYLYPEMFDSTSSSKGFLYDNEDYSIASLDSNPSRLDDGQDFFARSNHSFVPASYEINFMDKSSSISFSTCSSEPANIGAVKEDDMLDLQSRKILEQQQILSHTTLEIARAQKQLDGSKYSSFNNIRTRNGFGPNPRSIVERERRMKITEKLKKLEELLPNKGKHRSYAEMLESAVTYIKNLGHELQELQNIIAHCRCAGGKRSL